MRNFNLEQENSEREKPAIFFFGPEAIICKDKAKELNKALSGLQSMQASMRERERVTILLMLERCP